MCPAAILLCIYMLVVTYLKPKFFWQSAQVKNVRCRLGEGGASLFYYAVGGGALALGLIFLGK